MTTAIGGNPTINPIIAADSQWQQKYNQDTSNVSPSEKNDADALTGQIYSALHDPKGPNFGAVIAAVNTFSGNHGINDPVSQDLTSLLSVARYENAVNNAANPDGSFSSDQVQHEFNDAQSALDTSGASGDVDHLIDYANQSLGKNNLHVADSTNSFASGFTAHAALNGGG